MLVDSFAVRDFGFSSYMLSTLSIVNSDFLFLKDTLCVNFRHCFLGLPRNAKMFFTLPYIMAYPNLYSKSPLSFISDINMEYISL